MIATVSCRQLSPPLAVAVLLLFTVLASLPVSAAATVQSIAVTTDRTDYVNMSGFNRVTATASVSFNGNGALDAIRFDWFAPGGPTPFRTVSVPPRIVRVGGGESRDSWVANLEGVGFTVFASINVTAGGPPEIASPPATFNVYNRSAIVVVTDVVVTTTPVYENGTVARALADLTYAVNASVLSGVRFDWYYPGWLPAFSQTVPNPQPISPSVATATGTWAIDRSGNGFHVNATYLGSGSASNTTGFDVVPRRVNTWLRLPWGINGTGILDLASSPWGVCTNTSVNVGAQLIIQPGVVVRFCRDTGLFVNGTLTVDATQANRVYFLSYELQMQAGDWRGIAFSPLAPSNSFLSNVAIQAVTEGVTVRGTSLAIRDSTIALATRSAVSLTASGSSIRNTTIAQADIGVLIDGSTGVVLDGNRIQGTRIGVRAMNSDITLSGNDITRNRNAGLQANRTTVVVDGGTFRDNGVGVFFSEVPQAALGHVAISGGKDVVTNVVEVQVDGFTSVSAPRTVDMRESHTERFLVVPATPTPGTPLGIDAILLLLLAVVMGTVLLVMPVMRRRKDTNGAARPRAVPRAVVLERGSSYLLPDEKLDRAFQILGSEIARGVKALVIARLYPDEVRKRYGLKDVPVLWLSRGYGKETVNPTNLGALVQEIERFMSGKEDSVILLDGLEYLLVQNDPQKVVKFVQVLVDSASVHHSKLLVSFDVKSVNEAVRALITRDLQDL